jgi:hypothetical protein
MQEYLSLVWDNIKRNSIASASHSTFLGIISLSFNTPCNFKKLWR